MLLQKFACKMLPYINSPQAKMNEKPWRKHLETQSDTFAGTEIINDLQLLRLMNFFFSEIVNIHIYFLNERNC